MAGGGSRLSYVVFAAAGVVTLGLLGGAMAAPSWQSAASAFCDRAERAFGPLAPCGRLDPQAKAAAGRNALWYVVHDLCLPLRRALGLSFPCLDVDEKRGFAVLRAPLDKTQVLLVPTAKIEGIESPALVKPDAPNYWAFAWEARSRVAAAAERPLGWDDLGMAINAKSSRSQDQLHIHVDCLDPRLKQALAATPPSGRWMTRDLRRWGGRYHVKRLGPDGLERNLFKLIAEELPGVAGTAPGRSVAIAGVVGKDGARGFVVLVDLGARQAEDFLDHGCGG